MNIYQNTITKEAVAALPKENFEGKITIVSDEKTLGKVLAALEKETVVGFDTETRPAFAKGSRNQVALMQIATQNRCYLLRLCKMGFPAALLDFLASPDIKKIGLSLKDDFHVLRYRHSFQPNHFIDLQNIIKNYGIEELSLQKIYAIIFNKKISKTQRLTNWEAEELTRAQQEYAALDAWACLKIYQELQTLNS
ncbi:MAG: 3'-5' exonuclease domain-containing protein 2 [Prevotellaceae bacterium]|jgi:ribonuclease D|nr:3'-5' exonuclease domain-containing protein 2 [Prevotellaceae bacterium]